MCPKISKLTCFLWDGESTLNPPKFACFTSILIYKHINGSTSDFSSIITQENKRCITEKWKNICLGQLSSCRLRSPISLLSYINILQRASLYLTRAKNSILTLQKKGQRERSPADGRHHGHPRKAHQMQRCCCLQLLLPPQFLLFLCFCSFAPAAARSATHARQIMAG